MISSEEIRRQIIDVLLVKPELGKNYIDFHTDNLNECGVTIIFPDDKFEIIIKKK